MLKWLARNVWLAPSLKKIVTLRIGFCSANLKLSFAGLAYLSKRFYAKITHPAGRSYEYRGNGVALLLSRRKLSGCVRFHT
jgi:hypothetical protein